MGKQRDLIDADREVHDVRHIKCDTCDAVTVEGTQYCLSCGMYWEDVRNGLFDRED